ncbi:MAG: chromate transporter [Treponema sp.]|nr:chromate transporter [Treponema sp.]
MNLFYLLTSFFRIGLFSVGGGLAIIPFINEMADNSGGWLSREMVVNMLAVAQSLPGAIGANLSAYVGFANAGVGGAYIAAISLTIPAIIMIMFIARTLDAFKENITVKNLFSGFRPAATGLISAAGFGVIAMALWNSAAPVWYMFIQWKEALIFIIIFFLIFKFNKHPILYIFAAGFVGVILKL